MLFVPHAVWYRSEQIIFPPELSYRTQPYAAELPRYNEYIGRLQRVLQQGRPVVDIGVLYPIHGLQAAYYFGPGEPYTGGVNPDWADYMDVGERLSLELRHDFTYVHPETLDAHCSVADGLLHFQQAECPQQYRLLIVPGTEAISVTNLAKIADFFDRGGQVVATTRLPDQSAEPGQSDQVRDMIRHLFGDQAADPRASQTSYPRFSASSVWQAGGYDVTMAFDGDPQTRWNAQDQCSGDQWLEVDFGMPRTFQQIALNEVFDRATQHRVEYWDGAKWISCASGAEIGVDRTHTFVPVTAPRVRLLIPQVSSDTPSIAEFAVLDAEGTNLASLSSRPSRVFENGNARGGKAWFLQDPSTLALRAVLDQALPHPDVAWQDPLMAEGGHVSYLHKEIDGRQFWFFTNSSDTSIDTTVTLRGEYTLERWDPHTGRIETCHSPIVNSRTQVRLQLDRVTSVFFVSGMESTERVVIP